MDPGSANTNRTTRQRKQAWTDLSAFRNQDSSVWRRHSKSRRLPPARRLVTLVVDADDADVWADEPIWHDEDVVGFVTSGGYAHYSKKSVALGFVPVDLIDESNTLEVEILGDRRPATLVTEPLFDPAGERMRG